MKIWVISLTLALAILSASCDKEEEQISEKNLSINVLAKAPSQYKSELSLKFGGVILLQSDSTELWDKIPQEQLFEIMDSTFDSHLMPPWNWTKANNNSPGQLFLEVQDVQTLELISVLSGLPEAELKCISIVFEEKNILEGHSEKIYIIHLYQLDGKDRSISMVHTSIEHYIKQRYLGHTREYITASNNISSKSTGLQDSELKDILEVYSDINLTWMKKINEETLECEDGDTERQVNYAVIDGEVAWCYPIIYGVEGTLDSAPWDEGKRDAKEFDPAYKAIIDKAEEEAAAKMKKRNISGIGSCHTFWDYKKEYLEKRGIDWKSPSELNPGILFD